MRVLFWKRAEGAISEEEYCKEQKRLEGREQELKSGRQPERFF